MLKKNIITLTDAAAKRIEYLLSSRQKESLGIKVKVKTGGCSGLSYVIEYADDKGKYDEEIQDKGVKMLIDPKAIMYLIGSVMDYFEDQFKSGFIFTNPNEKGKCGCGKSFNV